jgi:chromosome segregation ATPase
MTDAASWSAQFGPDGLSPVEQALAYSAMEDARDEAKDRREQAEREAAREDRLEALAFANRQAGDPLGELQRSRAAFAAADDECRDLAAQLAKAQARRDRAQGNVEFLAARMQEATSLASRSAATDLLSPAKEAMAEARQEAARQRVERMLAARSASRPKGEASRSRGDVVPGPYPGLCHCANCEATAAAERENTRYRDAGPGREITRGGGYIVSIR